jgi:hypothetical protein
VTTFASDAGQGPGECTAITAVTMVLIIIRE